MFRIVLNKGLVPSVRGKRSCSSYFSSVHLAYCPTVLNSIIVKLSIHHKTMTFNNVIDSNNNLICNAHRTEEASNQRCACLVRTFMWYNGEC